MAGDKRKTVFDVFLRWLLVVGGWLLVSIIISQPLITDYPRSSQKLKTNTGDNDEQSQRHTAASEC